MEVKYNSTMPQEIENGNKCIIVNYNTSEVTNEEIQRLWDEQKGEVVNNVPDQWFKDMYKYKYNSTIVPMGQWTRDGIINAIIRDKYRQDEMEAITNNMAAINAVFMQTLVTEGIVAATKYLKESINDANTARFKEMQEWRAMAKKVASEIIKD